MSDHEGENLEGAPELGDEEAFETWEHPDPDDSKSPWGPEQTFDIDVPPVIGDLRPGETLEQRNARLAREFEREKEADRPEGTKYDPFPDRLVAELLEGGAKPPTRSTIRGSAVKVVDQEGNENWRELGVDDEAVRTFVETHGFERGFSLNDLRRSFPAGRQRPKERLRRRVLAEIIAAADRAGAKTSALEKALGLDRRRISELRGTGSTTP